MMLPMIIKVVAAQERDQRRRLRATRSVRICMTAQRSLVGPIGTKIKQLPGAERLGQQPKQYRV